VAKYGQFDFVLRYPRRSCCLCVLDRELMDALQIQRRSGPVGEATPPDIAGLYRRPARPDPDRRGRFLKRLWHQTNVIVVKELAIMGEALLAEGLLQHFDRFVEPRSLGLVVGAKSREFLRPIARCEAEDKPAIGKHVEKGGILSVA